MIAMRVRKLNRRHICSVNKCRNRDTFLIHRGADVNYQPLYLCEDCIRDIAEGYVSIVGAGKAKEVFGRLLERLNADSETVAPAEDEKPKNSRKKKV